jgi:putative nucleotidyltransferase with HDIG domain
MDVEIKLPGYVKDFMDHFKENGYEIFAVGGSIRDVILKKQVLDWDFTTNARPEEIRKLYQHSFYNNSFGTVGIPIRIENETHIFEVTTYRTESNYFNKRHPDKIEWSNNVEDDLKRRDFTINALAYDGKNLINPFEGMADIKNKKIKSVGNPDDRFKEDALRLMRAIRFTSQLGFMIEEKTRESIKINAHLIKNISWERIRDEILRIMKSDHPAEGVLFLKNTELLKHTLPELDICFEIPQKSPKRHHIYDVGTHLVMSLKHCPSKNPITRLATLLHDIGKADTYRKDKKTGLITFYNHEVVGKNIAQKIANRLKLSKKESSKLVTLVAMHQFSISEKLTDKAIKRFIRQIGQENIEDILDLRTGDRLGSGAKKTSWRFELFKKRMIEVQYEPFKITDLKINGTDIMEHLNLQPGPQVGNILKDIFEKVDDGHIPNEREHLLHELERYTLEKI